MSAQLDQYYRGAKDQGYRARSAFKLLQVDDECQIFEGVKRAVDLCAAPGSWSQVLSRRLYAGVQDIPEDGGDDPRVVAVDLQHLAPIPGVKVLQGDITSRVTHEAITKWFGGEPADLIVSDGAPDVSGLHELDEYAQLQLIRAAIGICHAILRRGSGAFVAKVFVGQHYEVLHKQLQVIFDSVKLIKPTSSRPRSAEHFVTCQGFNPPDDYLEKLAAVAAASGDAKAQADIHEAQEVLRRFAACGQLVAPSCPVSPSSSESASAAASASASEAPSESLFSACLVAAQDS